MLNQQYCCLCMELGNEFIQREYCHHSYCKNCFSTLYQFTQNKLKCPMCNCSYSLNVQGTKQIQVSILKELKSEFCCPICDYLIVQPVVLKSCQHFYCFTCLINILDKSQQFQCFVCGQMNNLPQKLKINEKLQNLIAKFWPDQYKIRFFNQDLQQKILQNSLKLRLSYGNKHKKIDNNIHQWIGFVTLITCRENQKKILEEPEELIQSVKFTLPESYKNCECKLQFAPFQIIRKAWAPCTISILVKFRGQFGLQDMELKHTLNFEKDIHFNSIVFVLDQHKLNFQKLCYILPKIEQTRKQYNFKKLRFSIICGLSIISEQQFTVFVEMKQIQQEIKYQKQNQLAPPQVDGEKLIEEIVIYYKKGQKSWDFIKKQIFQSPFSQTVARKDIERIKVHVIFRSELELISQQYTLEPSQLKGDLIQQENILRIDQKRLTEYFK